MKQPVENAGDMWTWTAIEADTKLLISWLVGGRDSDYAIAFIDDLRERLANRVQLTSDGHTPIWKQWRMRLATTWTMPSHQAVWSLPKTIRAATARRAASAPARIRISGKPDPKHVSTSYAERQNLTMRMQMRRFTRLTNAFSKKFENHMHMVALYTVWYNYVKQHKSLKGLSPAMAAGLSDTLWSMTNLAEMVDTAQPKPGKRGPYKKSNAQIRT